MGRSPDENREHEWDRNELCARIRRLPPDRFRETRALENRHAGGDAGILAFDRGKTLTTERTE